jgi:arylformamidase
MKLYDISLPVQPQMPVWPGDPKVELTRQASIAGGSDANVSYMASGVHMGTHVDAPLHFIDGAESVDQLDLQALIGKVHVVDFRGVNQITSKELEAAGISPRAKRLLFKTDNSTLWQDLSHDFYEDFVAVSADGAEWLVERGLQLVGIDYLSIAPFHDGVPTHQILLGAGVVILEGLNLAEVPPGRYTIYCLPLNLVGSDGAPARVLLMGP